MSITLFHVLFAIISLIVTGVTAFKPVRNLLRATYVSIGLTLGSGVLLAVVDNSLLLHVCTTGLVYLAIESVGVVYAVYRLRRLERVAVTVRGE